MSHENMYNTKMLSVNNCNSEMNVNWLYVVVIVALSELNVFNWDHERGSCDNNATDQMNHCS